MESDASWRIESESGIEIEIGFGSGSGCGHERASENEIGDEVGLGVERVGSSEQRHEQNR